MNRYLAIDEEGFIALDGLRVDDPEIGRELLTHLKRVDKDRFVTTWSEQEVLVEAFDEPLVIRHIERQGANLVLVAPYGYRLPLDPKVLCLDPWDRFHGITENQISYVFSRSAQSDFFNLLDEFDDESITWNHEKIEIPPFFITETKAKQSPFWDHIYQTETPGWELGKEAAALPSVLPQLKLNRSRILVLGCGTGQDAAYLAKLGHVVTAVDFSAEAIERAKASHSQPGLTFLQADVFELPTALGPFDVIFEHACFPAIAPELRPKLVEIWRKQLVPGGHLLGIFFLMAKRGGPPYGLSEWELRERLKRHFRFLYWTRWRNSIPRRVGRELIVYAQKLT